MRRRTPGAAQLRFDGAKLAAGLLEAMGARLQRTAAGAAMRLSAILSLLPYDECNGVVCGGQLVREEPRDPYLLVLLDHPPEAISEVAHARPFTLVMPVLTPSHVTPEAPARLVHDGNIVPCVRIDETSNPLEVVSACRRLDDAGALCGTITVERATHLAAPSRMAIAHDVGDRIGETARHPSCRRTAESTPLCFALVKGAYGTPDRLELIDPPRVPRSLLVDMS
jgi:hypothetical protein